MFGQSLTYSHDIFLARVYNSEEEEARNHLPIKNDQDMRVIFGRTNLREAAISIMKKNLASASSGINTFVATVRNELFSDAYQERRCLANRAGGFNSKSGSKVSLS